MRPSGMERYIGDDVVNGVRVVKLGNGGQSEEWFAPDFGCAMVRSHVDFGNSVNEQTLISLAAGEPDAALF